MTLSLLILAAVHPLTTLVWHTGPWSAWSGSWQTAPWNARGAIPRVTTTDFKGRFLQASDDRSDRIIDNESRESLSGSENHTVSSHNATTTEEEHGYMTPEMRRRAAFFSTVIELMISVTVFMIFSAIYKPRVTDKRPTSTGQQPTSTGPGMAPIFRHGLFSCCEDMDQCMHGWCCPYTRAADTMHAAGVWTFWEAFNSLILLFVTYEILALMSAGFLGNSAPGMLVGGMLFGYVFGKKRGELRVKSGAKADFLSDFATWWCCACCAIVQEARHIDENQAVRVNCCCQLALLLPVTEAAVVGPPVMSGKALTEGQPTVGVASSVPTVIGTPVLATSVVTAPVVNADPNSSTKQVA